MPSLDKHLVIVGILSLSLVLSGCGGGGDAGLHPLSGSATFDGEPIDLGSIALIPVGGGGDADTQRASGGVIKDGTYAIPKESGPNAGKYRIEVHWLKKTGKELIDPDSGEKYDERIEALPAKFHSKSELTIEIPAPDNKYNLSLTTS